MAKKLGILMLLAAIVLVATAASFSYRQMSGTATVKGPADPSLVGTACVGFYSAVEQPAATAVLPLRGTNYQAPTYGNNRLSVTPSGVICQVPTGGGTVYLYESISVSVPITTGHWVIRDFYAIGYPSNRGGGTVYLYARVSDVMGDAGEPSFDIAKLWFYRHSDSSWSWVDLRFSTTHFVPLPLTPGDALWLELEIKTSQAGSAAFRVELYFTHEQEQP
ncbi:MAG: hypothetical protein N3D79_04545 [Acidilobaceae archaeon]|nr:hypothetical protein [Acidilobaceae archaeon]